MPAPEIFHETDPLGHETLERLGKADRFNRWLFDVIYPFCKGHVLEVGSGIGNLSKFFLAHQSTLTASDLRKEYCDLLAKRLGNDPHLAGILSIDLAFKDFSDKYRSLLEKFDTVVALNVVEHIQDDSLAIHNCKQLLKPGGRLIILVPAYQALYNLFDKELGHYVRYTAKTLRKRMEKQGLEVFHTQYFNAVGIMGWILNGGILKKKVIPLKQLQLFDKLVPVIKLADNITFHSLGLSVMAVGKKV
jgi:2-polyprenyl-3-methyl-5-hydroxy-6-metoxy-1,4-benzoquinol methylase